MRSPSRATPSPAVLHAELILVLFLLSWERHGRGTLQGCAGPPWDAVRVLGPIAGGGRKGVCVTGTTRVCGPGVSAMEGAQEEAAGDGVSVHHLPQVLHGTGLLPTL